MNYYKLVREIRTQSGVSINESEPMRFAEAMNQKASMFSRDVYYHSPAYKNVKKMVYWITMKAERKQIKVHMVRV